MGITRNGFVLAATGLVTRTMMGSGAKMVSARGFQRLFTQAERIAIRAAAAGNATIEDFARLAEIPEPINLASPTTAAGLTLLVSAGLLTAERRLAILAGTPPA